MPSVFVDRITVTASAIDLNDHVNNREYVGWMQDAATAHSRAQGWTLARYRETGTTWVIRSHFIEYVRPAFLGEQLLVATWVAGMNAQSSPRKYRFVRARDGKTVVEAESLWVFCATANGRPLDILPEMREAFPLVVDEEPIRAALAAARAA